MSKLRKRGWDLKTKDIEPLDFVWKLMYGAVDWFRKTRIGLEKGRRHRTATGRYPARGRHVADWELDVWGAHDDPTDTIVKINLWSKKGKNVGETYRVSVSRADRIALKLAEWVGDHIREMERGRL